MSMETRQDGSGIGGRAVRRWRRLALIAPLLLGLAAVAQPAAAQQGQDDPFRPAPLREVVVGDRH